jgi:hypothetical protein
MFTNGFSSHLVSACLVLPFYFHCFAVLSLCDWHIEQFALVICFRLALDKYHLMSVYF